MSKDAVLGVKTAPVKDVAKANFCEATIEEFVMRTSAWFAYNQACQQWIFHVRLRTQSSCMDVQHAMRSGCSVCAADAVYKKAKH